jgi:hypothetical protein
MPSLEDTSKILVYQKSNLFSIQHLYGMLQLDLASYLAQEQRIRAEIPELVKGLVELTEAVESGKAPSPPPSLRQPFDFVQDNTQDRLHQGRGIDFPEVPPAKAGCMGTLMDLFLVKIPGNPKFLLTLPKGYALTTWIRDNARRIQEEYVEPIKQLAETTVLQKRRNVTHC